MNGYGEPIQKAVASVCQKSSDQIVAIGVNCVYPETVVPLIKQMEVGKRDLIAYPNAGIKWDKKRRYKQFCSLSVFL